MSEPLLVVRNLRKHFGLVKAVEDVSFEVNAGEAIALVGESGCGKSTTALNILGLQRPTSGTVSLDGVNVNSSDRAARAKLHRSVQAVFQDPFSSMNPRQRVNEIVAEPLIVNTNMTRADRAARVAEVLVQVGLTSEAAGLFPHEFSGGQRQRIALARALALSPKLIVLDEPVSALDVSIRAQIMNLLKDIQQQSGVSYLLIAHDLATVRYLCQRVVVMYLGRVVEQGVAETIFSEPLHPYTRALLSAALPSSPDEPHTPTLLPGEVPSPLAPPPGCPFHPRCPQRMAVCASILPIELAATNGTGVACHLYNGTPID